MDELLRQCWSSMLVVDTLLDLEEEAVPASETILGFLPARPSSEFPNVEKHLNNWKDDRDQPKKDAGESEEDFEYRLQAWRTWPEQTAKQQEQWLRCATVTYWVLDYVVQHDNPKGHFQSEDGHLRAFLPKRMYEYLWICLKAGEGTRVWKVQPPMPRDHKDAAWYAETAKEIVASTAQRWQAGEDLGKIHPTLTLDDLLPAPSDMGVIRRLEAGGKSPDEH